MKYFDTFTGYGGFTLGIQRAYSGMVNPRGQTNSVSGRQKTEHGARVGHSQTERNTDGSVGRSSPLCIGYSEINKYAIQVYEKHFPEQLCELHTKQQPISEKPEPEECSQGRIWPTNQLGKGIRTPNGTTSLCNCRHKNYGDITQINPTELPDFDLLTGGFPCQAFSIAGKRQGFNDTRGTLFFDIARILKEKRPRNFILENVKGLLSHDNGRTFKTIITTLTELGYCVEWQVLNAKDFGVPQNRERVFIVGHLGGVPERKVFPIGADGQASDELHRHIANTLTRRYEGAQVVGTYVGEGKWDAQTKIRRLTPKECERLMGLPDDWTEGQSDTQRYKLCGNGVVVNVVEAVVRRLYDV